MPALAVYAAAPVVPATAARYACQVACPSSGPTMSRPALMESVWRSRIIGSETTLTAKINPANTPPHASHEGA